MKIFKNSQKKEFKDIKEVLSAFKKLEDKTEKLSAELKELKEKNKFSVQKIGMVRFNPFSESGGDQSFSIALLDENKDGIIITSLYTRGENRVYGKPIKGGKSEYQLSEEEKIAISKAEENDKKN
jgi:hypothetical protein